MKPARHPNHLICDMETLIDSLLHTLEHASSRSIGSALGLIAVSIWWIYSRIRRAAGSPEASSQASKPEAKPRHRLPLRAYHR